MLTLALAGNLRLEPWPQEPDVVAPPSAAEREWATGDPVEESEPEPELFVPVKSAAGVAEPTAPAAEDTPETVAAKMQHARGILDSHAEHFHPDFGSKLGKKK
jgi:hypothetical protein